MLGSHVFRCPRLVRPVALVWWIDVVLVPWTDAGLVLAIDVVRAAPYWSECSTDSM